MLDDVSRLDWLKTRGVAGAGALISHESLLARVHSGRGSGAVYQSGFGRFNTTTLSPSSNAVPTLQTVDDTFTTHRDIMAGTIRRVEQRTGLS
jgi:hypothetical protein